MSGYLLLIYIDKAIDYKILAEAIEICYNLTNLGLPIPAACTGPDGQVCYVWDNNEHHLEIEFIPDSPIEFFYRNRETGECFDSELCGPLSDIQLEKVNLFKSLAVE